MNQPSKIEAIWCSDADETFSFFGFRRRLDLNAAAPLEQAALRITVHGAYRLWINGRFVGRGPAHSGNEFKRYDMFDIRPFLAIGGSGNVIAIEVVHFPFKTAHAPLGAPGLWCEIELNGTVIPDAPEAWRARPLQSYFRGAIRRTPSLGIEEHFDARAEGEWQVPRFDDSGWACASPLHTAPWSQLIPRGFPQLREEDRRPVKIWSTGEVQPEEFSPTLWGEFAVKSLAVYLLKEIPEPATITSVFNAAALLRDDAGSVRIEQPSYLDFETPEQRCATVILDFGEEMAAYFELDVEGNEGAIVDVSYGEEVRHGRVPALVHQVHYADRYTLREGRQTHEFYDWKGFRYVQLTFRRLAHPLLLHRATARRVAYPVSTRVRFHCSDEQLNAIWKLCARTQEICMQDRYIDCPWREQAPWLLDAYVTGHNPFGETLLRAKVIEDFAQSQREDGSFPSASFTTSQCHDQAFTWALLVRDHLKQTGQRELAPRYIPNLERFFQWCDSKKTSEGVLGDVSPVHLDWSPLPKKGTLAIVNGLYGASLKAAVELARWANRADLAQRWSDEGRALAESFPKVFWNEEHGYFSDLPVAEKHLAFSQQAQAAAVFGGLVPGDKAASLLARAASDSSLIPVEAYLCYFWMEALSQAGLETEVLRFIQWRWGVMVQAGATSAWEIWKRVSGYTHTGYRHNAIASSCHGYSGYPATWLIHQLLGIEPGAGANTTLGIHTLGLTEASGTVETAHGLVSVQWNRKADGVHLRVEQERDGLLEIPQTTRDGLRIIMEPAGS